jgi:hypothetical protein
MGASWHRGAGTPTWAIINTAMPQRQPDGRITHAASVVFIINFSEWFRLKSDIIYY